MSENWLEIPGDTTFGLANPPYGVFSRRDDPDRRVGVAIGHAVLEPHQRGSLLELGWVDVNRSTWRTGPSLRSSSTATR